MCLLLSAVNGSLCLPYPVKEQLQELEDKIAKGLEGAYEKMLKFKKHKNTPLVFSKDGKIVKVYPEDL